MESPIAGTDYRINYIAYYTQMRTLGVLHPDQDAEEADRLLREMGVRTYIIPSEADLAYQLRDRYNYIVVVRKKICESEYLVLRVSE